LAKVWKYTHSYVYSCAIPINKIHIIRVSKFYICKLLFVHTTQSCMDSKNVRKSIALMGMQILLTWNINIHFFFGKIIGSSPCIPNICLSTPMGWWGLSRVLSQNKSIYKLKSYHYYLTMFFKHELGVGNPNTSISTCSMVPHEHQLTCQEW
jgi:hypothetical protein